MELQTGSFDATATDPAGLITEGGRAERAGAGPLVCLGVMTGIQRPAETGSMAELLGVRSWFIGGGIVCIIMAGAMTQIRSILAIEDSPVASSQRGFREKSNRKASL